MLIFQVKSVLYVAHAILYRAFPAYIFALIRLLDKVHNAPQMSGVTNLVLPLP